ncbi:MAG TPA: acyl-CoA dehydrogenase, partial [Solibacterales bacterium]|nr:acyl-CoA dehydrogenase [Bryobacterales bacterium]
TNEINRLLATGMLLKRAQRGQLALVDAVKHLAPVTSADDEAARLVGNAKKLVLFALGLGYRRFRDRLEKEQEVVAGITDLAMSTFAAESVWLRVRKLGARAGIAQEMAEVFLRDAMRRSEAIARDIVGVCSAGDEMDADLALLAQFTEFRPMNAVAARRRIAARLLDGGRYIF